MKIVNRIETLEGRCLFAVGDLITSFGAGGYAVAGQVAPADISSEAIHKLSSGKLMVVGQSGDTGRPILARLLSNGQLDSSFGQNGMLIINNDNLVGAVHSALGPDGNIYLSVRGSVLRLSPDGVIDPTFSGGVYGDIQQLVPLADGSLFEVTMGGVFRLDNKGALVHSFGDFGELEKPLLPDEYDHFLYDQLAIQSDGKLLVAGVKYNITGGTTDLTLLRYTTNGLLDNEYGDGGIKSLGQEVSMAYADNLEMVLQSNNYPIIGYQELPLVNDNTTIRAAVSRYNTAGELDTAYAGGKRTLFATGKTTIIRQLELRPDGKLAVLAGRGNTDNFNVIYTQYTDALITQMTTTGSLDLTFDSDGVKSSGIFPANTEYTAIAAMTLDGTRLDVVGSALELGVNVSKFMSTAILATGATDTSYGTNGYSFQSVSLPTDYRIWDLSVNSSGEINVAGSWNSGRSFPVVKQFTGGGQPNAAFGTNGTVKWDFNGRIEHIVPFDGNQIGVIATVIQGQSRFGPGQIGIATLTNGQPNHPASPVDFSQWLPEVEYDSDYANDAVRIGQTKQMYVLSESRFIGRTNADGSQDMTFGINGQANIDLPGTEDVVRQLLSLSDGVLAYGYSAISGNETPYAMKFDATGAPFSTFGTAGKLKIDFGTVHADLYKVLVDASGNLIALGKRYINGTIQYALANYDSSGKPIVGNDGDHVTILPALTTKSYTLHDAAIDPQGRVYILGKMRFNPNDDDLFVARTASSTAGVWDNNFSTDGYALYDIGSTFDYPSELAFSNDRDLIISGTRHLTGYFEGVIGKVELEQTSLAGSVYNDLNGDGTRQSGETAGLSGRQVYIDLNKNNLLDAGEPSTLTLADGSFLLSLRGVPTGLQTIRQNAPAGWSVTNNSIVISVSGSTPAPIEFGEKQLPSAMISGLAFNDANANGTIETGEALLAGKTIYIDANNDKQLTAGEVSVVTTSTGEFRFEGLDTGSYALRVVLSTNQIQTVPSTSIALVNGQAINGILVGINTSTVSAGAMITGSVFNDNNKNTTRETAEAGLANITIWIDHDNDKVIDANELKTTTDASGNYLFSNVPLAGSSSATRVRAVIPSGGSQTLPTNGYGYSVNLAVGATNTKKDFGIFMPTVVVNNASMTGMAFNDDNSNGLYDEGEVKAGDRTVYLDQNLNGKLDTGEKSVLTDPYGVFTFTGLAAGTYYVRRVFGTGYVSSTPLLDINLAAGQQVTGLLIGSKLGTTPPPPPPPTTKGSIAGYLFSDLNKNGKFDSAYETYQSGKTVFIDLDGDNVLDSNETKVTTDSKGAFKFSNLNAGTYKIRRVVPTGYKVTTAARNITLTAGQNVTGVTIGSATV